MVQIPHRKHRPSRHRFLGELWPAVAALLIALYIMRAESAACAFAGPNNASCAFDLPRFYWWLIWTTGAYSVLAAAYRFYRDVYRGDYRADCTDL
ncbi:hypothetical protein E4K72_00230 [Oxalobacteraceae bacterium OM1]|nr:hypothetical protein E4K72_00230 [Oxalobacteraceae bacterium OM1]